MWCVGALCRPTHVCAQDLAHGIKFAKLFLQVITLALVPVRRTLLLIALLVASCPTMKLGPYDFSKVSMTVLCLSCI